MHESVNVNCLFDGYLMTMLEWLGIFEFKAIHLQSENFGYLLEPVGLLEVKCFTICAILIIIHFIPASIFPCLVHFFEADNADHNTGK